MSAQITSALSDVLQSNLILHRAVLRPIHAAVTTHFFVRRAATQLRNKSATRAGNERRTMMPCQILTA